MNKVKQSSKNAFQKLIKSGARGTQHGKIIAYLKQCDQPKTRKEIAKALDMETSTIAARINELVDCDAVLECGSGKCSVSQIHVGIVMLNPSLREAA